MAAARSVKLAQATSHACSAARSLCWCGPCSAGRSLMPLRAARFAAYPSASRNLFTQMGVMAKTSTVWARSFGITLASLRKIAMKGMRHGCNRPGEGYLSPGWWFAARYTDEGDAHQRSADQHFRNWEPRRHTGNGLDLLSQRHAGAAPCGQECDQATRDSPRIRRSPSSARQPHDQRSQSLRGRVPRELGQFGCLLPGMEVQSRKRREDAERHFISLHADRRVEKVVELGSKEGNGSSGIHDDHQWCDGTL